MRIAILSLCKRQADFPQLALGLTHIGNSSLLKYQIMLARRAGAEKILCHIDAVPGELARHESFAKERGLDWVNIRSIADISHHIDDQDEIILMADGFYCGADFFDRFAATQGPIILTADADGRFGGFERLDINTVWAGLLKLPGSGLADLSNVPDDWSLESVMLRQAIAGKTLAKMMTDEELAHAALSDLAVQPVNLATKLAAHSGINSPWRPFDALTGWAARRFAPMLWKNGQRLYLADVIIGLALLGALLCAWFTIPMAAIILALLAYIAIRVLAIVDQPLPISDWHRARLTVFLGVCGVSLALVFAQQFQFSAALTIPPRNMIPIALFAAFQWVFLQIIAHRTRFNYRYLGVCFEPFIQAGVFLIASAAQLLPDMLLLLAMVQLIALASRYLFADNVALTNR